METSDSGYKLRETTQRVKSDFLSVHTRQNERLGTGPYEMEMSGEPRAGNGNAGNRRSWALLALLVLATTAKFAAFAHAMSFGAGMGGR
jgi:hypothetical protein